MLEANKLASVIVRNLAEIEEANYLALNELSDRVKEEIVTLARDVCSGGFHINVSEETGIVDLFRSEWVNPETNEPDFWLSLDENEHNDNKIEHSWLAAIIQSEPTPSKLSIWFNFRHKIFISEAKFAKLLNRETDCFAHLVSLKFLRDDSGKYLLLPVDKVEPEALALAFENGDFDKALDPICKALVHATSEAVFESLTVLITLVRKEAQTSLSSH